MSTTLPAVRTGALGDGADLSILADERRRTVLRCLRSAAEPIAVADLARDVTGRERDVDVGEFPADAIESVYVDLHHVHLPKLADAGYVRYLDDGNCVALTDDVDSLVPALERIARRTD